MGTKRGKYEMQELKKFFYQLDSETVSQKRDFFARLIEELMTKHPLKKVVSIASVVLLLRFVRQDKDLTLTLLDRDYFAHFLVAELFLQPSFPFSKENLEKRNGSLSEEETVSCINDWFLHTSPLLVNLFFPLFEEYSKKSDDSQYFMQQLKFYILFPLYDLLEVDARFPDTFKRKFLAQTMKEFKQTFLQSLHEGLLDRLNPEPDSKSDSDSESNPESERLGIGLLETLKGLYDDLNTTYRQKLLELTARANELTQFYDFMAEQFPVASAREKRYNATARQIETTFLEFKNNISHLNSDQVVVRCNDFQQRLTQIVKPDLQPIADLTPLDRLIHSNAKTPSWRLKMCKRLLAEGVDMTRKSSHQALPPPSFRQRLQDVVSSFPHVPNMFSALFGKPQLNAKEMAQRVLSPEDPVAKHLDPEGSKKKLEWLYAGYKPQELKVAKKPFVPQPIGKSSFSLRR